jgi:hypothetical protein
MKLSETERGPWRVFKAMPTNVVGNFKAENYELCPEELVSAYSVKNIPFSRQTSGPSPKKLGCS